MDQKPAALMRQTWLRQVLSLLFFAALLFAPAGTLRFWQGWAYGLIVLAASTALGIYFLKHDPALLARRMAAGPAAEQDPAQKVIISTVLICFVLLIAIPGFDFRWHWSTVPLWLELLGNGGVAVSFIVFFVVLKQNSYAASTVRVETNQPVVSTGLYGIVRHPMYAGALLLIVCTPLALGSYWGLLLLIPSFLALGWRLLDEERILKRDLPGYADYCRQTRYRLIPFVW